MPYKAWRRSMLSSCAWPVRSRQTAAAPTPPAIAGIAMQAPSRKRLRRIGSRPVKRARPPPSSALPPMSRIKSAKTFSIEKSSPVAAWAAASLSAAKAAPITALPVACSSSRRFSGIVILPPARRMAWNIMRSDPVCLGFGIPRLCRTSQSIASVGWNKGLLIGRMRLARCDKDQLFGPVITMH